jgi:hypothetical protein
MTPITPSYAARNAAALVLLLVILVVLFCLTGCQTPPVLKRIDLGASGNPDKGDFGGTIGVEFRAEPQLREGYVK